MRGVKYRYGFNGKENDNEVKGDGNQQDYGMRIYDPRVGRFLSVDPIASSYPMLTPYQFASNSPIQGIDFDGLELVNKEQNPAYLKIVKGEVVFGVATSAAVNKTVEYGTRMAVNNAGRLVGTEIAEKGALVAGSTVGGVVLGIVLTVMPQKMGNPEGGQAWKDWQARRDKAFSQYEKIVSDPSELSEHDIAESQRRILEGNATAQDKLFELPIQSIARAKGGAARAATYSDGWGSGSLSETVARFAPNARGVIDGGKTKYLNSVTGIEVVYDNDGNYFRVFDTKLTGRRGYLDLDGNIPNNKIVNGKQMGRSQSEYNQVTHFNNTDK